MKLTKEQLEYELVIKHLELRDGVIWAKEFVDKRGRVWKVRPAKGTANSKGYLEVWVGGKRFLEHRIIFILTHNRPIREGYQIHHKYGNKTDNRIEHLEEVTHQVNCQNKQIHLDGHLLGTSETKWGWVAYIHVNGKTYNLGTYNTQEDAHKVYLLAAEEVETYGHLVRSRVERATTADVIPCTGRKRLRDSKSRGECEALEHDQLRTEQKRG